MSFCVSPPARKLANLFRIDDRDLALGLVTQKPGRKRDGSDFAKLGEIPASPY